MKARGGAGRAGGACFDLIPTDMNPAAACEPLPFFAAFYPENEGGDDSGLECAGDTEEGGGGAAG